MTTGQYLPFQIVEPKSWPHLNHILNVLLYTLGIPKDNNDLKSTEATKWHALDSSSLNSNE